MINVTLYGSDKKILECKDIVRLSNEIILKLFHFIIGTTNSFSSFSPPVKVLIFSGICP